MKPLPLFFALTFLAGIFEAKGQSYDPAELIKFKQDTIGRVFISKIKSKQVYIPLGFNSSEIRDLSAYNEIKDYTILKVELIYSSYKKLENFDQPVLNAERLKVLKAAAPELFSSSFTRWKFTAQTDCKNEEDARQLFHGFIITYRPEMTTAYAPNQFGSIKRTIGKYVDPEYDKIVKNASIKRDVAPEPLPPTIDLRDSVVLVVLKRNKNWKEMPVVCDATGSMVPYITQTLIWLNLNLRVTRSQYFTFFNDGDNMPDNLKVLGNTGGIYMGNVSCYDSIEKTMFVTMANGTGGDSPENNLEALIRTQEKYPQCKELVMIADNLSNVRDIELLPKLKRPVHIVLCGTQMGINAEYLDIARATGGSVHTIESDITNLMELNEGEYFTFKGQKFVIDKGKFKLVYGL